IFEIKKEIPKFLKDNLDERDGLLYTKNGFSFMLTGEISLMYTDDKAREEGKNGRRVHLVVLAPSFDVVDKINNWLDELGRRDYDGRPIFNIACEDFVKKMAEIDDKIEVIPAHIWTPWFGLFGSKTGFDSLNDAFGSQVDKIHAIETGISSDRKMNLKISELHNKTIMSNSDSHSFWPWRIGREATLFSSIDSYDDILKEIRENKIIGTIEVEPAYGKYHFDGHAGCDFSCPPIKTRALQGRCPKCGKQLTLGVDYRVDEIASGNQAVEDGKKEFKILPLHELLSLQYGVGMNSKKIWKIYWDVIEKFDNEFRILLEASQSELAKIDDKLARLVMKNRQGKIKVKPGYDGVYGKVMEEQERLF
ncbi:MAG: endonuclease Q family protein, partial [Candidatus Nanoarchaeia archaeon]